MLEHFPHRWHVYRNLKWSALCETKQWPIKHSSHPCRMSFSFGHVLSIKSSHMRLNGTFSSENIDCFSQRTRCFRRNRFYYADMHKQISTKPNAVSHYIVDLHLGWVSSTFATNGRIFRPSRIDFSSYVSMSTYV